MKKFLIVLLLPCLIISCKEKTDFKEELAKTAELRSNMKSAAGDFFKIDTTKIGSSTACIDAYLGFVTQNLKDTISPEEAILLSNFKSIKKSFGKYIKAKKQVDRYYEYNLKQLDNLEHDLKEGIIVERDSAVRYLGLESTASTNLADIMKLNNTLIPMEIGRFDSLKPLVEEFIKKINKGTIPPDLLKQADKKNNAEEEDD